MNMLLIGSRAGEGYVYGAGCGDSFWCGSGFGAGYNGGYEDNDDELIEFGVDPNDTTEKIYTPSSKDSLAYVCFKIFSLISLNEAKRMIKQGGVKIFNIHDKIPENMEEYSMITDPNFRLDAYEFYNIRFGKKLHKHILTTQ